MGRMLPDKALEVLRATRDWSGQYDRVGSGHPRSMPQPCTNDQRLQFCSHRLTAPPDSDALPSP